MELAHTVVGSGRKPARAGTRLLATAAARSALPRPLSCSSPLRHHSVFHNSLQLSRPLSFVWSGGQQPPRESGAVKRSEYGPEQPNIRINRTMRNILPLVAALSVISLSGCISAKQHVSYPDQTKSVEDPSKGRIYVVRPASGGKGGVRISVADVKTGRRFMVVGDMDSGGVRGQHLCWESAPGKIRVIADTIRGGVVKNGC